MNDRDQMAVEMLRVILLTVDYWNRSLNDEWHWDDIKTATELAYRLADAMQKTSRKSDP